MVGAEIVTVAAAESAESNRTMSRLAATVVLRILLFYVLSILLILCIVPWTQFKSGDSSFALALERIGIPGAATIMNVIVLTAVLSCLNSGVYVTARVLFAMADKGDAPRWLTAGQQTPGAGARHPAGQRFRFHRDGAQLDRAGKAVHLPAELLRRAHDVHLSIRGGGAFPVSVLATRACATPAARS